MIGWPNRGAESAFSGGAWSPALPLSNLSTREPWKVARSIDLLQSSTKFDCDLGSVRNLRSFALGNHNLSRNARWRILLGTAQSGSDIYDSAWQAVWTLSFDSDLLEWGSLSFWEGAVDDPYAYTGYPYPAVHVLPDWSNARYLTILIDDPENPAGYVQIGKFFAGGGFQPEYNASYGLKDSWIDPTMITDTESGYSFADSRRRRRRVQFSTDHMDSWDAAISMEIQRRQGVWGEVLWVPYPHSQPETQRYGFIGRMTELPGLDYPRYKTRSISWAITET